MNFDEKTQKRSKTCVVLTGLVRIFLDVCVENVSRIRIWIPDFSVNFSTIRDCVKVTTQNGLVVGKSTFPKTPWDVMGCQNHLFGGPRGVTRRVWCFHRRGREP